MRAIDRNAVIHIDVTNACFLKCRNCTRHVGHHRTPYFMDMERIREGIRSLADFPGMIGIMGGEPTMHPRFRDLLATMRELVPDRRRRALWTAGFKWDDYRDDILETFDEDLITFNDHTQSCGRHHPLLLAIDDMIPDRTMRRTLIDACPFQSHWSASITPKGAFFCEIAASLDWLFDGPGGYVVEPGWWKRRPQDFQDQVDRYCGMCSGALPAKAESDGRGGRDGPTVECVSASNFVRLGIAGSPKLLAGHVMIRDKPYDEAELFACSKDWNPRSFRDFEAHVPEDAKNILTGTAKSA